MSLVSAIVAEEIGKILSVVFAVLLTKFHENIRPQKLCCFSLLVYRTDNRCESVVFIARNNNTNSYFLFHHFTFPHLVQQRNAPNKWDVKS